MNLSMNIFEVLNHTNNTFLLPGNAGAVVCMTTTELSLTQPENNPFVNEEELLARKEDYLTSLGQ